MVWRLRVKLHHHIGCAGPGLEGARRIDAMHGLPVCCFEEKRTMFRQVIPIHQKETTEDKLIVSVGRLLARSGFDGFDADAVATEAGVDRSVIFRTYGGLAGLVAAFGETREFWPDLEELKGQAEKPLDAMSPGEVMAAFFKALLTSLLKRPQTLEIMAWEGIARSKYSRILEQKRVRTSLEFFEHMKQDPPPDVDLTALVALIAAGALGMATRSRVNRYFGGIDLHSDKGWARMGKTLDQLFATILDNKDL